MAVAIAFTVLVTVTIVVEPLAVMILVANEVDAVDVTVVRAEVVAEDACRLQADETIEAANEVNATGVCKSRFLGVIVLVETKEVTTLVLVKELTLGVTVERTVLAGLTTTVAVEVGALKPNRVEQKGCRVEEPMILEAEATAQGIAGPPAEVELVKV